MLPKRTSVVITKLLTCLILMGFAAHGYSQEESKPVQNPETQRPAKLPMLKKRPDRYPTALAGLEVLVDLTVSPPTYTGSCPAVFTFYGKITVNRATIVQYRFVRSDNTRHSLGVLVFEKPGTQEVSDTWAFDDTTQLPTIRGWEAIQTNFPMKVRSNLAYINGTCTDFKGKPPTPESQEPLKGPAPDAFPWPQSDPNLPPVSR